MKRKVPILEGQLEMQLTKIQELLNGERRGRKFGVVLDFVVGVFQQWPKQPHVDSLDLDSNVTMTDTQEKRDCFIPAGVDSWADGSPPPPAPADSTSLAWWRTRSQNFFFSFLISKRTVTSRTSNDAQSKASWVCLLCSDVTFQVVAKIPKRSRMLTSCAEFQNKRLHRRIDDDLNARSFLAPRRLLVIFCCGYIQTLNSGHFVHSHFHVNLMDA